ISTYEFYCPDGTKSSTTPVSSCTYTTPGTYYLWTVAIDNDYLRDANKTYITVLPLSSPSGDTTPPTLSINSPASGATVSGTVTGTGTATDNVGVSSVTMTAGSSSTACTLNGASYSCSWNTSGLTNQGYTITVTAKDAANNSGTSSINVTLNNPDTAAPTV